MTVRSHYCGALRPELIGSRVSLCGWVHRRRDHGGVIFIDLRDREGIAQIVFDPDVKEAFALAESVRSEYVLEVDGLVRERSPETINAEMATGSIEVLGKSLRILNRSQVMPFQLDEYTKVGEDTRLRHRYLDLRRPEQLERLRKRAEISRCARQFLEGRGFWEIETPMLTRATPEGARDYLVPARVKPGHCYALPQSPQLFKQLLMAGGIDRYYQIARCFRDEDLRADRQPEFTQIDLEASFLTREELMEISESLLRELFQKMLDIDLPSFPTMNYAEAMRRFASDRPDLRNPLELVDIADLMKSVEFKVFSAPAKNPASRVVALKVAGGAQLSRKQIDDYTEFVSARGAKGLAWIKINDRAAGASGLQSPILKFIPEETIEQLLSKLNASTGDIVFFGAGKNKLVNESMGPLRDKLGADLSLIKEAWRPVWVIDFPMFERDSDGALKALHHPFTAPACSLEEFINQDPINARSEAYDIVLNGNEVAGGSLRIHDSRMQTAVFKVLGIDEEHAQREFGFLLDALAYGCPPHGGIAFGLDRLVMLISNASSIRDVIAFPKTQSAACLMSGSPGKADTAVFRELGIKILQQKNLE